MFIILTNNENPNLVEFVLTITDKRKNRVTPTIMKYTYAGHLVEAHVLYFSCSGHEER